ncbi:excinuclease ABC subunit UvrC [Deferribacter autotrophicus]|uniref:UvrABC system protein C n=1 Tax=Deferribacter autotrophicus TaxID=500465 RepID=A0A5A8F628_9BACT|nr:excinuclease ABC subunit UvrC [Deferribacter autotrophicus]KAA0258600.1 excinuclease ABC subunit UvrC [Deferribacter autotrophicus]
MKKIKLDVIPALPGVYIFLDEKNQPIYVGKARNIKKRVSSYFTKGTQTIKTKLMLEKAKDLKFIVTSNEVEALLLEANLIKNEKPKYNILLKDSKSYPYLKITTHEYPKIIISRKIDKDGKYIGPFVNVGDVRGLLKEILKLFPIRTCSEATFKKGKICINYQIKRCSGPCEKLISKSDYLKNVENIVKVFSGQIKEVEDYLREEMLKASKKLEFEKAAELRDRIEGLKKLSVKQIAVLNENVNIDIFYFKNMKENIFGIAYIFVRGGKIIGVDKNFLEENLEEDDIISFVSQYYYKKWSKPEKFVVIFNNEVVYSDVLESAMKSLFEDSKIKMMKRIKREIIGFAERNIEVAFKNFYEAKLTDKDLLNRLAKRFSLSKVPNLIECADISHLGGEYTVGVSIAYENGKFNKSGYRRYKIKTVENDDFAAMYELFYRKGLRIKEGKEPLADLYIIDGGKGQLSSAIRGFEDAGVQGNFIAIAKGRSKKEDLKSLVSKEEVFLPERKNPITFQRDDSILLFVQKLRDEAHRFAIEYQRKLMLKNIKESPLITIEGVGEKTAKKVLKAFPDIYVNKNISSEDLINKCKIPQKIAEKIIDFVRNKS